ncbi:MAG: twin-arginine translocase TatA/TatE family subunit [Atopobiaceae bacterium]|nr:twin-arginine translocase TatA/TatE family subunit [Atopobiaceae bacterium]
MIAGLGVPEIAIILIIVLIIFGPKNLPKLGKSLGQTVKNVREGMESDEEQLEGEVASAAQDLDADIEETSDYGSSDYSSADFVEAVTKEPESEGVFCTKCGTNNPADSAFCSKCGAELASNN